MSIVRCVIGCVIVCLLSVVSVNNAFAQHPDGSITSWGCTDLYDNGDEIYATGQGTLNFDGPSSTWKTKFKAVSAGSITHSSREENGAGSGTGDYTMYYVEGYFAANSPGSATYANYMTLFAYDTVIGQQITLDSKLCASNRN